MEEAEPLNKNDGKAHLLLCASGSVATIKIPNIISALARHSKLSIRLIFTASAVHFLAGQSAEQPDLVEVRRLPNVEGIYLDEDEWSEPWKRGGSVLHIELRRWTDLMVVAPLSANTLAKMAGGWSDNLLLSVIRAWDTTGLIDSVRIAPKDQDGSGSVDGEHIAGESSHSPGNRSKKTIVVAPAMNTAMWNHPVTSQHIQVLNQDWGVERGGWVQVLRPMEKELACGDVGSGAMVDWSIIVRNIEDWLQLSASQGHSSSET